MFEKELLPEQLGRYDDVFCYFHAKRTPFLAIAALDTIGCVGVKRQVMLTNRRWRFVQVFGKVIVFMYRGDINLLRTGQAVITIHTHTINSIASGGSQYGSIVFLLQGKGLVFECLAHLLTRNAADKCADYARAGEGVVFALGHRQRRA